MHLSSSRSHDTSSTLDTHSLWMSIPVEQTQNLNRHHLWGENPERKLLCFNVSSYPSPAMVSIVQCGQNGDLWRRQKKLNCIYTPSIPTVHRDHPPTADSTPYRVCTKHNTMLYYIVSLAWPAWKNVECITWLHYPHYEDFSFVFRQRCAFAFT